MTASEIRNFLTSQGINLIHLKRLGYLTESQYKNIARGLTQEKRNITEENLNLLIKSIPLYLNQSLGEWDKLNK